MAMTYKERMMAAIKGEVPDVIPYAPRLDLWYAAHSAADTLPGNVLAALLSIVKDAEDELSIELNEEIVNKYRVE